MYEDDEERVVSSERNIEDSPENSLRPLQLEEFIGQKQVRENLRIFVEATKTRGDAMDHVLFYGPPGLGKTTLAQIVARELGVGFRATSGPVIAKAGEIRGEDEPLAVSIDKEGKLFVQDTAVELTGLAPLLMEISKNNQDIRIFVRGDESISYGSVMEVMGVLNKAGFSKVALIARNPATSKKK